MQTHMKIVSTAGALLLAAGCQSSPSTSTGTQVSSSPADTSSSTKTVSLHDALAPVEDFAGFPSDRTASLWVKGISCPYCVTNIDRQLAGMPGVEKVHVDLPTGQVRVALSKMYPATRGQLIKAIEDSGFTLDRVEMPQ